VSGYIIVSAIAVGLPPLVRGVVGIVAVVRSRREDIPAVVRALVRASPSKDDASTDQPTAGRTAKA
jgi:hypothetical protein